jgi:hypothetical protein
MSGVRLLYWAIGGDTEAFCHHFGVHSKSVKSINVQMEVREGQRGHWERGGS